MRGFGIAPGGEGRMELLGTLTSRGVRFQRILLIGGFLLLTTACQEASFEVQKSAFLKNTRVLDCPPNDSSCDAARGVINQPGSQGSASGSIGASGGSSSGAVAAGGTGSSASTTGGSSSTQGLTGSSIGTGTGSYGPGSGTTSTTTGSSSSSTSSSLPITGPPVDCSNVTQQSLAHGGTYPAECKFDRPQTSIPFSFICSTSMVTGTFAGGQPNLASTGGVNLYNSNSLIAKFEDFSGNTVCTISDPNLKNKLLSTKRLDLVGQCPQINSGTYRLRLIANGSREISFNSVQSMVDHPYTGVQDDVIVNLSRDSNGVLYASNPGCVDSTTGQPVACGFGFSTSAQYNEAGVLYEANPQWSIGEPGGERCDQLNSPLVVQLPDPGQDPEPLVLSSQVDGVWFDILGQNSFAPHAKKRISWLAPNSRSTNYFVALPDRKGEVRGIDQLFGDNTMGPDGRFAANGYEALRKFDLNHDGVIDRKDPIFPALRLWADRDGDGVAERSELWSLTEKRVEMIDLKYDASYFESDRYGNEIRYKSVVRTTDGRLHLIFDIWFRLLP